LHFDILIREPFVIAGRCKTSSKNGELILPKLTNKPANYFLGGSGSGGGSGGSGTLQIGSSITHLYSNFLIIKLLIINNLKLKLLNVKVNSYNAYF